MPVTINANGLSIVHKGSDGEATASVPDVCLTTRGKSTDPIPYGNNAKSSDLIDGSTTVFADGGNSIALKGSKFSKSTGDSGGDKKGVTSGTIEGEAEFITSSPTVIIEGKGVARLSDQMTMNNGNTMCFGVQNPSLTVDESLEVPCNINICVRHPNGHRLINADYELTDENGAPLGSGTLGSDGRGVVSDLKPGKIKLNAKESNDDFVTSPQRQANPHYIESLSDDAFFDIASKGKQAFWKPTRIQTGLTPWGSIGQCLSSDKYFQNIVKTETQLHFSHSHPKAVYSFDKVSDAIIGNIDNQLPHTTETLLAYSMPMELEEGDMLSVLLRLAPYETTDRMLAYMRAQGKGNPQSYLGNYDWAAAKKTVNQDIELLLNKINARLEFLRDEASKLQYAYLSEEVFDKHIDTLSTYIKKLPDLISGVFNKMENKAAALLANTSNVNVIKAADSTYSAEAGVIEAVINTTQTIDTVEPYMNEVAGTISNVMPIYPVRYGYANFFGEPMPAQAPPVISDMQNATGLKETGGYLLRLLREGWIYIKEEGDKDRFHIFKYAQTETATGVIEKFEKYYFTNEENAQDGLTLDTSSGATFYPFAFVTANTKEISIAYSEHEWSATIIDKMNGDEDLRKKSMQRIDLSNTSSDFSVEANQDNLSTLVEDYRTHDKKWLTTKTDEPKSYGLDKLSRKDSYYLSPEGITKTIQKSHSEKKDGVLVALFDPVGRQADIAYALTLMTIWDESNKTEKHYPTEIANIINTYFLSSVANEKVKKAAEENVDLNALKAFNNNSIELKKALSTYRQTILNLFMAFAYQDLSDGKIGSLDTYLKMYFDIELDALQFPEMEVIKLASLTESIFDGVSTSKEGQIALIGMIDNAYENDGDLQNSHNTYFLLTENIKKVLTQCQQGTDWGDMVKRIPEVFGNLWASAKAQSLYGTQFMKEQKYNLSSKAINKIVDSFLPVFFEQIYGITYTNGTTRISQDELGKLLAKHIDLGGKKNTTFNKAEANLKWAKTLFDWGNIKKSENKTKYYELPEIKKVLSSRQSALPDGEIKVGPISDFVGTMTNGGITGLSWYLNLSTLYGIFAQSDYSTSDPLARSTEAYNTFNLTAALAAITVDSVSIGKISLELTKTALNPEKMSTIAQKVLPKVNVGQVKLGALLSAKMTSTLIAGANIAMVLVSTSDSIDDWESGNVGGAVGNATLALSAASFGARAGLSVIIGTTATGTTAAAIGTVLNVVGFILLVVGVGITWIYSKSYIENLLFRCFWGKSDIYSFWYFEKDGKYSIENRLELASRLIEDRPFQVAYDIEIQEFINILMQPSVTVSKESNLFSNKVNTTYEFVLPNFIWEVSEIVGSIQKQTIDIAQPIQHIKQVSSLDESGTQAFTTALQIALEDPAKHELKEGVLHLKVNVELDDGSTLHWYYKPKKDLIVPKRMLTQAGVLKQVYIGMKDDAFI
ncbi:DUF4150 domain-containing protein [Aliivibrio fischeri]|uniref:PAAR-like domain-containing protein n=1 Tax=Aliivibrio fischeri TaxID=668 RepID=UPI0012D856DA|nr:PAAR-like domain-containing protein [Aliivibrio fischeri]MUL01895.1 DUF4150 domain-containing protein [Aliivibrio fischeri]